MAHSFSDTYDINFNIAKSELVVYGKKGAMECSVTFNGVTIVSKGQGHIGNIIGLDSNTEATWEKLSYIDGVADFQKKVNVLMCTFKLSIVTCSSVCLKHIVCLYMARFYGILLIPIVKGFIGGLPLGGKQRRVWKISL